MLTVRDGAAVHVTFCHFHQDFFFVRLCEDFDSMFETGGVDSLDIAGFGKVPLVDLTGMIQVGIFV
jgi:hypothetical protein